MSLTHNTNEPALTGSTVNLYV
uniref:Uncharacterized protein n=1 Tax=Anguilla anguilla TaxID=7936 RepID=A0A0E9QCZ5_ANGAN